MNSVNFTGRIATELELRQSKSGNSFLPFTLVVRSVLKDANGKNRQIFIKCLSFRTNAELIMKYSRKGNMLGISGSLAENYFVNKEGIQEKYFEVIVDNMTFLEPKKAKELSSTEQSSEELSSEQSSPKERNITEELRERLQEESWGRLL